MVTDIDGNFSLEVPDKDKTLVIEFLGMSTLTAKIPANGVLNVSCLLYTSVLGVLFGKINISFSDSVSFSPGLTGGVLMVALLLSAVGKTRCV